VIATGSRGNGILPEITSAMIYFYIPPSVARYNDIIPGAAESRWPTQLNNTDLYFVLAVIIRPPDGVS